MGRRCIYLMTTYVVVWPSYIQFESHYFTITDNEAAYFVMSGISGICFKLMCAAFLLAKWNLTDKMRPFKKTPPDLLCRCSKHKTPRPDKHE